MTMDWRAYALSAYICSRVEHDSFLALDTGNMAGPPAEPFSRRRFSICHRAASWQPVCGGTSSYDWRAAADELDGRTRPSEHDGSARYQGPPPGSERQRESTQPRQLRRGQSQSLPGPA